MSSKVDNCTPPSCTDQIFSEETDMKRDLGLVESISIVIGRIIGSGIFRTPAPIMLAVGSTSLFGFVWMLGGIATIFGAVCYAELVAMMPRSGGPYIYIKASFGPLWAFLRGWATFFVSETGAIAAVALVFAEYLNAVWLLSTGARFSIYYEIAIALAAIWILTAINLFGVFLSGMVQNIFSSIKVLAIGAIIGISFTSTGNMSANVEPFWPDTFGWDTLESIGKALRYAFFAFSGWQGATFIAEEVKNPRRNLPLSLFLGIAGVTILYIGANLAYLNHLSVEQIKTSKWVASEALKVAIGSTGGILIAFAVMINTFGNVSTQILCKARTWQAMARDGLFFKGIDKIHPRFKTPNNSLIIQGIWASILLIFAGISKIYSNSKTGLYETIIDYFSATGAVFVIMTFLAVFVMRRKYPDVHRPYKAWLYPFSLIVIIIIYAAYLLLTIQTAFWGSMAGFLLTATGLIYYFFVVKRRI